MGSLIGSMHMHISLRLLPSRSDRVHKTSIARTPLRPHQKVRIPHYITQNKYQNTFLLSMPMPIPKHNLITEYTNAQFLLLPKNNK